MANMNTEAVELLRRYDAWREDRDDAMSYEAIHGHFPNGDLFYSDDEAVELADALARWVADHTGITIQGSIHDA